MIAARRFIAWNPQERRPRPSGTVEMRSGWPSPVPGVSLLRDPYRSFDSMEEYRRWMERHYPEFYGYGRVMKR